MSKNNTTEKAAAKPLPIEIRSWASRLRAGYPSDSLATTEASHLDLLAEHLSGANGPTIPPPSIPPNMRMQIRDYAQRAPEGMGKPFGQPSGGDIRMLAGNKESGSSMIEMNARCLGFVAPQNLRGTFFISPGAGVQVVCISPYPGDFRGLLRQSRLHGSNKTLSWTTIPGDPNGCPLVAGNTYYINLGKFNFAEYVATGEFKPVISAHGVSSSGCPQGLGRCGIDFVLSCMGTSPN